MESKNITELDLLRDNIDKIDSELIHLLHKRFEISKNIGIIKKQNNVTILDSNREEKVKTNWKANSINEVNLLPILETILTVSKDIQSKL